MTPQHPTPERASIYSAITRLNAVRDLVVAVNRYVDAHSEADEAVRNSLWRAMTAANDHTAELFKVYPL